MRGMDHRLAGLTREQEKIDDSVNREYQPQNIITPFYPNGDQRKFLSELFGRAQIDMMTATMTMADLGLIDHECPPLNHPDRKYRRLDPYTGNFYCTLDPTEEKTRLEEGIGSMEAPTGENACDETTQTEAISEFKRICVPKIIRGQFSCPPADRPADIKIAVLRDGTGICIPKNSSFGNNDLFGMANANEPFTQDDLMKYIALYRNMGFKRRKAISQLNGIYRMYDHKLLRERLTSNNFLSALGESIGSEDNRQAANVALYLYARDLNIISPSFNTWSQFFKFGDEGPVKLILRGRGAAGMSGGGNYMTENMTASGDLPGMIKNILAAPLT